MAFIPPKTAKRTWINPWNGKFWIKRKYSCISLGWIPKGVMLSDSISKITYYCLDFFCRSILFLFKMLSYRKTEVSLLVVHSSNSHKTQSWADPKLGASAIISHKHFTSSHALCIVANVSTCDLASYIDTGLCIGCSIFDLAPCQWLGESNRK